MLIIFFKQKTAYEMRISDWSSDVCSSDLIELPAASAPQLHPIARLGRPRLLARRRGGRGFAQCGGARGAGDVHTRGLHAYRPGDGRSTLRRPAVRGGGVEPPTA